MLSTLNLTAFGPGVDEAMSDPKDLAPGLSETDASRATTAEARPPIRPDMTTRQIAQDYPSCKDILRRHGEPEDRRTKFGHLEPLDHFASRRGLDLEELLAELARVADVGVDRDSAREQQVHRPFIAWAIAFTLTLGAGWGAILLFEIGWHGSFDAISSSDVVAHGAAQLWGFVGLFIVGIALRYLPMINSRPPPGRASCRLLLASLLGGVIGGFIWSMAPQKMPWLGPLSGAALELAAVLFLSFLFRQVGRKLRFTWARAVSAAGIWLFIWAGMTLVLRTHAAAEGPGTYSEPIRQMFMELAIFGFSMNAIYGFGQRLLAGIVGIATPRSSAIEATFWLHNAGVVLLGLGHMAQNALAVSVGVAALAAGAFSFAFGMRGFVRVRQSTPRPEAGPVVLGRYVQLAFFWLLAGLILLLAGELYWNARGLTPPHSYVGAVRHALTVGFMTTLILGVGQRLLPILGHRLLPYPRLVLPIFVLIAVGNLFRVVTEFAAARSTVAFALMPISSVLELAALVLFAVNALRTLWPPLDPLLRTGQVVATTSVAVLLSEYPWLEDHLFDWGLDYIGRVRSVPRELTLGSLAKSEGKAPVEVIARINDLLRDRAGRR
jgi:hypothetical protein